MTVLRLVLAGAAIGNGNRGVEALGRSVARAVDVAVPGSRLAILDDGWGVRAEPSGRYTNTGVELVGVRRSRRWYRPESWARVRTALLYGGGRNAVASRFVRADAVLDISGGDSFTDMYGPTRLRTVCAPKHAALQAHRPLVLLPQTIGPFETAQGRAVARRLLGAATISYARDPHSYDRLLELAGSRVDPSRLREGVDVAFALEAAPPATEVQTRFEQWSGETLAGVNLSGLLIGPEAVDRFGLAGDYLGTMTTLVRELIARGAFVVLLPHVHVPGGGGESDLRAIDVVLERLGTAERDRTAILPVDLDASELKWCVAQLDWFAGSRMHSTIAGLSSLVPTFGYAYSAKTEGVFATCGMSSQVADARRTAGQDAVRIMLDSFEERESSRAQLAARVPTVNARARQQLADLLTELQAMSEPDDSRRRPRQQQPREVPS